MSRLERVGFEPATDEKGASIAVKMPSEDLALFYTLLEKWQPDSLVAGCLRDVLLRNIKEVMSVDPAFEP